jgi:hypothetical protein
MSVYWERLSGRTDRFAVKLSLAIDPHGGAAADSASAASWGAFEIWIDGQNICAHFDQGELLSSVHWYLLPLLEWLVGSWDPLLHEERLPVRNAGDDAASASTRNRFAPILVDDDEALLWEQESYAWWTRHAIRAARDGGLFPNLFMRRFRDSIELSWDDRPTAGEGQDFKFLASRGLVRLSPSDVAAPLWEVAVAAATELSAKYPDEGRLVGLLDGLRSLTLPNRFDPRISWLAGLGAYEPTVPSSESTGRNGFGTVMEQADPLSVRLRAWTDAVKWMSDSGDRAASTGHSGVAVTRRFTLAHELCHLLHDRNVGARLAVASGPWAPRGVERRANAFAAMFLMPPDLVTRTLAADPEPVYSPGGVRFFADALQVSLRAAVNHLHNLGLLDEPERDRLLVEAPGP